MSDSGAPRNQYAQKGRLEIMLDEFSELHGTVLMGMHRELQTLKQEVQSEVDTRLKETRSGVDTQLKNACRSVETQLKEFLSQYAPAEDRLAATVSNAQRLDRELGALVAAAQAYRSELAALQAKSEEADRQRQAEFAKTCTRLQQEFNQQGRQEVDRLIESGRSILEANKDDLLRIQLESVGKIEAMQKATQSLLVETQASNKKTSALLEDLKRDQALHATEVGRFNRLRFRTMIGLGSAMAATVGVWIWLTVTH